MIEVEAMDTLSILKWLSDNWIGSLIVVSGIVQISPIKINPWSAILKWVGQAVNAEVRKEIAALRSEIGDMKNQLFNQQKAIDENEMDRIRWEVLDFANACRNHAKHTKDEFQHVIALNEKYHSLLEKYGDENGVFDAEYNYILELYHACQHNNNFP